MIVFLYIHFKYLQNLKIREKNFRQTVSYRESSSLTPNWTPTHHFFFCLNTSFIFTNYQARQCNASHNRAFIIDRSLSGIMTSKLVISEFESSRNCSLIDSDFMNDEFLGHYPILNNMILEEPFITRLIRKGALIADQKNHESWSRIQV